MGQQLAARRRKIERAATSIEKDAANRADGVAARAKGAGVFHPSDDRALEVHLHQVLAEIDVATSDVSVESVEGVVRVRGQVASEADIARVVRAINGVPGVQGVESLMARSTPAGVRREGIRHDSGEIRTPPRRAGPGR